MLVEEESSILLFLFVKFGLLNLLSILQTLLDHEPLSL
jgi:hypothetical protein